MQERKETRPRRRRGGSERGQAVVETALVLPILLTALFGIIVFGTAFDQYEVITGATSSGAQTLSISRGETTDPCNTAVQAVYAAAPDLTHSSMTFAFNIDGVAYTGTSCSGAQTNLVAGQNVQVTVTYPCKVRFMQFNPEPTCALTAQTQARIQ